MHTQNQERSLEGVPMTRITTAKNNTATSAAHQQHTTCPKCMKSIINPFKNAFSVERPVWCSVGLPSVLDGCLSQIREGSTALRRRPRVCLAAGGILSTTRFVRWRSSSHGVSGWLLLCQQIRPLSVRTVVSVPSTPVRLCSPLASHRRVQ
jgi:hypothetical protein